MCLYNPQQYLYPAPCDQSQHVEISGPHKQAALTPRLLSPGYVLLQLTYRSQQ